MREIKFRAWDIKEKRMLQWNELRLSKHEGDTEIFVITFDGCEGAFNEYPLMQYTGLKDKNGTEIYEGDVLEYLSYSNEIKFLIVEWSGWDAMFNFGGIRVDLASRKGKIIGNIYEHSHLLREGVQA